MIRSGAATPDLGRLVLAVAQEALPEDLERLLGQLSKRGEDSRLVGALAWHGLIGLGRRLLGPLTVPTTVRTDLDRAYYKRTVTVTRALLDLAALAEALGTAKVDFAVLKGPVLAGLYEHHMDRLYTDLDILVRPTDSRRCLNALATAGLLRPPLPAGAAAADERSDNVALRLAHGSSLDLHVALLPQRWRRAFDLNSSQLLNRRRDIAVEGLVVPSLAAADLLLHVALHASVSGAYRLLWFTDLRQVMRVDRPSPEAVRRLAAASGLRLPLGVLLDRGRPVFGNLADVYGGAGATGPWRRAMKALSRVRPVEGGAVDGPSGRTLFAATRRDTASSIWALQRELASTGFWYRRASNGRAQEQQHYPEGLINQ